MKTLPLLAALAFVACLPAPAGRCVEPVNPNLSPGARKLLDYLVDIRGKAMLCGIADYSGWERGMDITGRMPAVYTIDFYGYHTKGTDQYDGIVRRKVQKALTWGGDRGGILAGHIHWGKPGLAEGSAWAGTRGRGTGPADVGAMVTPGTQEHKDTMADLKMIADYLQILADADVPMVWRPFHEIDGGWFWWTDKSKPENTAALYRMMFDYFVNDRKLNNLIWVFNTAHVVNPVAKQPADVQLAYRKRFYPGDDYVDIAGIDVYGGARAGWGPAEESSYIEAIRLMNQVAPGKPVAMCEGGALPNPDLVRADKAPWVYCLAWWTGNPDYLRRCYSHDYVLTLDELPVILGRNVAPNVRITAPLSGKSAPDRTVRVEGIATDRNGNLKEVTVHLLAGPWLNWGGRDGDARTNELEAGKVVARAVADAEGRWSAEFQLPADGYFTMFAKAADTEGLADWSNVVLVSTGLKDLARNATWTASEGADGAGHAADSDPLTAWQGGKKAPQWLAADLGRPEMVGAVTVYWTKAYARDYEVQVSADGREWRTVAKATHRDWRGDMDVVRFEPEPARHVRILALGRGTNWGGMSIMELGIFEELPEQEAPPAP